MKTDLVIPICCVCGKVREILLEQSGNESWTTLSSYLKIRRLNGQSYQLTHTYCPPCLAVYMSMIRVGNPLDSGEKREHNKCVGDRSQEHELASQFQEGA